MERMQLILSFFSLLYKVNPSTLAETNGLNAGDRVILINRRNLTNMTHQEAKMEITHSGNKFE